MPKKNLPNPLWLILGLATALRLVSLRFPFGDYDEGVYLASVRSVSHGFTLITQTYSSQGPLFVRTAELFYRLSPTISSVRLFPVLCSLVIIWLTYHLLARQSRAAAIFAALYLSVDSSFLTVSRTFQVDIPWLAFSLASLYLLLSFHRTKKSGLLLLSAVLFAISFFLKTNPLLIPVILAYFLLMIPSRGLPYLKNLVWYVLMSLIMLFVSVPISALSTFYVNVIGIRAEHLGLTTISWTSGFRWLLLTHEYPLLLLDLLAVILLAISAYQARKQLATWLEAQLLPVLSFIWLVVTVIIFSLYSNLFPHHFVFFILPAVLLGSYGVTQGFLWFKNSRVSQALWVILLGLIIAYSCLWGGNSIARILQPVESGYDQRLQALASYLDQTTKPNDYVVVDDQIVLYLADRNTPPDTVDTSFVRIQSGLFTTADLKKTINDYQPTAVALVSGRFATLPHLPIELTTIYERRNLDNGTTVYLKK